MEELVSLLLEFEKSDLPNISDDMTPLPWSAHPLVGDIVCKANEVLTSQDGGPMFDAMDKLYHKYGYFIFPVERDRFGTWVTACIRTKKGVIAFG